MFHLEIDTRNAAFEDDPAAEIARILAATADQVEAYGLAEEDSSKIRDLNGNTVGEWTYAP